MVASSRLLEVRNSQLENQEAQRWVHGAMSGLRRNHPPEALLRPTMQAIAVPQRGCDVAGLHKVASLWRAAGAMFVGYSNNH